MRSAHTSTHRPAFRRAGRAWAGRLFLAALLTTAISHFALGAGISINSANGYSVPCPYPVLLTTYVDNSPPGSGYYFSSASDIRWYRNGQLISIGNVLTTSTPGDYYATVTLYYTYQYYDPCCYTYSCGFSTCCQGCTIGPYNAPNNYTSNTITLTESPYLVWYADVDGDGAGDPAVSIQSCFQPPNHVANATDLCPAHAHKQAPGECGCDAYEEPGTYHADLDGDGLGDPYNSAYFPGCPEPGYVPNADDCYDGSTLPCGATCGPDRTVTMNFTGCTYRHQGTDWDLTAPACPSGNARSTFDASMEGWTVAQPADPFTGMYHHLSEGNPGGYIRVIESNAASNTEYIKAPAAFLGNRSAWYNGTLRFDSRSTSYYPGTMYQGGDDVRLFGNGLAIAASTTLPTPDWSTRELFLGTEQGQWRIDGTTTPATEAQILQVLAHVDSLLIRTDYWPGGEAIFFDNITMIPPQTYTLSGSTTGSGTSLDGVIFNPGTTTVTWTVTTACGTTSVCSFRVNVEAAAMIWYADLDGDGLGDPDNSAFFTDCPGPGYVPNSDDCYDGSTLPCNTMCIPDQAVATNADDCTYTHSSAGWDLTAPACTSGIPRSTFNGSVEGWTLAQPADPTAYLQYNSSGGNPFGCIFVYESGGPQTDRIKAPAPFLGDKSGLYNGTLRFDIKMAGYSGGPKPGVTDHVRLFGSGLAITASIGLPTGNWSTPELFLGTEQGQWRINGTTTLATEAQIRQVLAHVDSLLILADQWTGSEATFFDNIELRPPQTSYTLSGSTTGSGTSLNGTVFNPGTTTVVWTVITACGTASVCSFQVEVEATNLVWYADVDGDGAGDPAVSVTQCDLPPGYVGNSNDQCPNDPDKTTPGICGCGTSDVDGDSDGTADCNDACPADADKTAPGDCGCDVPDIDSDNDGTADCVDGCPNDENKTAPGACGCGVVELDADNDGICDDADDCPGFPGQQGDACDDSDSGTYDDVISSLCTCVGTPGNFVRVSVHALLEGAYEPNTGLMRDDLRTAQVIPLAQPYGAAPFTATPLHHEGTESVEQAVLAVSSTTDAIVDWVLLELRSPTTNAVQHRRAALIQRDGDVVDVDGASPVTFPGAAAGPYRIAIRHRNHLAAMTAAAIACSATPSFLDMAAMGFPCYGTDAQKTITGSFPVQALWAGDVSFNGTLQYVGSGNDRDPILVTVGGTTPNNTAVGYSTCDVDLDGVVKYTGIGNDRDPILVNVGGTMPSNTRVQQLP